MDANWIFSSSAPTGRRRSRRVSASCWCRWIRRHHRAPITRSIWRTSSARRSSIMSACRGNIVGDIKKGGRWRRLFWALSASARLAEPGVVRAAAAEAAGGADGRVGGRRFQLRFTRLRLDLEDHKDLYETFVENFRRREALGADVSMLKVHQTELFQRITEIMLDVAGEMAPAWARWRATRS